MAGKRVLVVEDEDFVRSMVVDALEEAGHDPIEAVDADEAMALLEKDGAFDLVFSDIKMPGTVDGVELAKAIARDWPEVRVILTSGHGSLEALNAPSGTDFLSKPYRIEALLQKIGACGQASS